MKSENEFKIQYDGEALKDHRMDVRDLAPALLSIAELFEESNRVINGNRTNLSVEIIALQPGSFGVNFGFTQSFTSQAISFLAGDKVASILALKELIVGGTVVGIATVKGLYHLIRWLKGRKPNHIEDLKNGYVKIIFNSETFIFPSRVLELYQEISIRKAVEGSLKPLLKDGVDIFEIYSNDRLVETIQAKEVEYFETPTLEDEKILEYEHESAYSIISLAFKEDNKWRLHDGSSTISVSVKDQYFLKKVEQNQVAFSKGDILICKVKTTQWQTENGLRTEYDLLEVIEHKKAHRQLSLFD